MDIPLYLGLDLSTGHLDGRRGSARRFGTAGIYLPIREYILHYTSTGYGLPFKSRMAHYWAHDCGCDPDRVNVLVSILFSLDLCTENRPPKAFQAQGKSNHLNQAQ